MRNLLVTQQRQVFVDLPVTETVQHICIDVDNGDAFVVTNTATVYRLAADTAQITWKLDLNSCVDIDAAIAAEGHVVTSVSVVMELESLCICTAEGALLLLHTSNREVEQVGHLQGGITAAAWSPDEAVLLLLTALGSLLLMNQEWDVLEEVLLYGAELSTPLTASQAAISWRGDGKFVATSVSPSTRPCLDSSKDSTEASTTVKVNAVEPTQTADLRIWERDNFQLHAVGETLEGLTPVLAWQPNGRHLYAAQQLGDAASVFLFEANGLQHGSFDVRVSGHITSMDWSADSELLALMVRSGSQQLLQVWHRSNWHWYLKREEQFPSHQGHMLVSWDDTIPRRLHLCSALGLYTQIDLARQPIVSERGTAAVTDGSRLLLTPLRHTVIPPPMCAVTVRAAAPITAFAFCNDGPCEKIAALLSDGSIAVWESLEDDLWEETAEEMGTLGSSGPELTAQGQQFDLPDGGTVSSLTWLGGDALLVARSAAPYDATSGGAPASDVLQELRKGSAGETVAVGGSVLTVVGDPSAVSCGSVLIQRQDGSVMSYQAGARLVQLPPSLWLSSPCPCACATPASALKDSDRSVPPLVGLTAQGQLLWGRQLIAKDITSFVIRSGGAGGAYLLYTTRENVMYTLRFSELLTWVVATPSVEHVNGGAQFPRNRGVGAGKQENHYTAMHAAMRPSAAHAAANDVVRRAVEQGAYLIAAPPHDVRVIMQLPRGNLETVAPRALVLSAIASSLQVGDYASAWDLAAPNRVDLNVLVDYGWPSFLANAPAVVEALRHDSMLSDLLAALRPQNMTAAGALYASMPAYKPPQVSATEETPVPIEDKIATVCSALRHAMEAVGQKKFLGAILMSYCKQGDMIGALSLIKQLKEVRTVSSSQQQPTQVSSEPIHATASSHTEQSTIEEEPMRHDGGAGGTLEKRWTAEDGMRYLLLYTDVEKLYKAALGLHDLALAYMVIAHSQRDPGEYMLELQGFASAASPALQKHAIDMHLGRWLPALQHLLSAGDQHFEAALQLAQNKGLLRELLALCPEPGERHNTVLRALAAALSGRNMHEDAGMALAAAGELAGALEAYRAGGQWRMALVLAGRLGYSEAAIQQLAGEMMEELSGMGQSADAAALAAEYLADADNAVALLSQARQWREALRIAYRFMRDDLVDTVIAPAGAEAASGLLSDARENTERVNKYLKRFREVQERRANMEAALADAEEEAAPAPERDFDEASEAGSAVSGMSAYTTASTTAGSTITSSGQSVSTIGGRKPQRKARQKASKGARIRQGSPQEEAALGVHITALAPSAQALAETGQLAELLVLLGHADDARLLQAAISGLVAAQAVAATYISEHPAAVDPASVRFLEASQSVAPSTGSAHWKWDMLRPVQLSEPNVNL